MDERPAPILCLLAIASACGSSDPRANGDGAGPDGGTRADGSGAAGAGMYTPRGGTRLEPRWLEGPDGQRSFLTFHDRQLEVDCSFTRAADGELRCLPSGYFLPEVLSEWADPACTAAVVSWVRPSCQRFAFVRRRDGSNPCEPRERVYRLGERIAENRIHSRPGDGPCVASAVLSGEAPFRVGEELPPATFVKAKLTVEPASAGGPLDLVVLEAEDGARTDYGFRNRAGLDCTLAVLSDQRVHCVPPSASVSAVTFADGACGQPAAFFQPACGASPTVARQITSVPGTCEARSTVHELGPRIDTVYRGSPAMCAAVALPPGNQYHGLGAELAADSLPSLEEITEPSPHPVWRARLAAPRGRTVGYGWVDAERRTHCFRALVDGKQRCVPAAPRVGFFFADAACTQPLLQVTPGACLPSYASRADDSSCPPGDEYFSVGERHTGVVHQQFLRRGQASTVIECGFATGVGPADVFHYVTALPPDRFPEMKLVEPRPK